MCVHLTRADDGDSFVSPAYRAFSEMPGSGDGDGFSDSQRKGRVGFRATIH